MNCADALTFASNQGFSHLARVSLSSQLYKFYFVHKNINKYNENIPVVIFFYVKYFKIQFILRNSINFDHGVLWVEIKVKNFDKIGAVISKEGRGTDTNELKI